MGIKTLRIVETLALNAIIGGIAILAIVEGAEPTMLGVGAIAALLLVNGYKLAEIAAVLETLNDLPKLAEALDADADQSPDDSPEQE